MRYAEERAQPQQNAAIITVDHQVKMLDMRVSVDRGVTFKAVSMFVDVCFPFNISRYLLLISVKKSYIKSILIQCCEAIK